jgi:hypothetical protein
MRKNLFFLLTALTLAIAAPVIWAQNPQPTPAANQNRAADDEAIRSEIEKLKQMVKALEDRLAAQEAKKPEQAAPVTADSQKATEEISNAA